MKTASKQQGILAGKWKQTRGKVKQWWITLNNIKPNCITGRVAGWGTLTDRDLDRINARVEEFIHYLQETYGFTHEEAENEVDRFLDQMIKGN